MEEPVPDPIVPFFLALGASNGGGGSLLFRSRTRVSAGAAAGIRDETGQQLGGRISFGGQLKIYQTIVEQLVDILGDEESTANHLSKCIFSVGMRSNDYLNNYFMPTVYTMRRNTTLNIMPICSSTSILSKSGFVIRKWKFHIGQNIIKQKITQY